MKKNILIAILISLLLVIVVLSVIYSTKGDEIQSTTYNLTNFFPNITVINEQFVFSIPQGNQTPYPSVVLTPEKAWNQTNLLIGKEISINGPITVEWACTDMFGENICGGGYMFDLGTQGYIKLGILLNGELQASCSGIQRANAQNISNIACNFLTPGETYTFTGKLRQGSPYTPMLDVEIIYNSTNDQIYNLSLIKSE